MILDYVTKYYLPLMEIDETIPPVKSLLLDISNNDCKGVESSYEELIDFIRLQIDPSKYEKINLYFRRMKQHLEDTFKINLQYAYFI